MATVRKLAQPRPGGLGDNLFSPSGTTAPMGVSQPAGQSATGGNNPDVTMRPLNTGTQTAMPPTSPLLPTGVDPKPLGVTPGRYQAEAGQFDTSVVAPMAGWL